MGVRRMRLLRQAEGLTQKEIARRIGLPQWVYSLIESGRLKPSERQARVLEDFFREPVEKLLRLWRQK
ncbi:MAG: hypothetical protein DDT21_02470 [Syntrophomonadaceae bacterium]|nr:hypothetical protein [Bacillota bacterium]